MCAGPYLRSGFGSSIELACPDVIDTARAKVLLREAALLGEAEHQYTFALCFCPEHSLERYVWLRLATLAGHRAALWCLKSKIAGRLKMYDEGASGRLVFEIGATSSRVCCCAESAHEAECLRAVQLHAQWCEEARQGVLCWLWLARIKGMAKDMRCIIARLIWDDRAAWSERERCIASPQL